MAKFTYASAFTLPEEHPVDFSSPAAAVACVTNDETDDACSICLEPFTPQDPARVTSCNHEYHLQCILEWSQRSKECPICWRLLVLKDPVSQELLVAVTKERCLRSRNISSAPPRTVIHFHEDFGMEEDASLSNDLEERIIRHLAAAADRASFVRRRERQRSSGIGPSHAPVVTSPANMPNVEQTRVISQEDQQNASAVLPPVSLQAPSVVSNDSSVRGDDSNKFRVFSGPSEAHSSRRQIPSEMVSLPESIKSKLSAASSRYKESLSKSTRGLKEKLQARNNSVKELSKGVQREMSAGIAGVARMIERLDLTARRPGHPIPVSASNSGTSNFAYKGKRVGENAISRIPSRNKGESVYGFNSEPASLSITIPGKVEISQSQEGQRC